MSLFGLKEKKEIERLRATLTPEQVELADLRGALEEAHKALAAVTAQREQEVQRLDALRAQLVQTEEELNLQSFGVYKPRYDLMRADEYRARLLEIRAQQKEMIKSKTAVTGVANWTVNNNAAQGLLGHAQLSTTMDIYAELRDKKRMEAAAALNAADL